jgi:hypothetical protein
MLITAEDAGKLYMMTKPTMLSLIKRTKLKARSIQAKVILQPPGSSSASSRYRVQGAHLYCAKEIEQAVKASGREVLEYAQLKSSKPARLSAE